jgi:hypothetical protein
MQYALAHSWHAPSSMRTAHSLLRLVSILLDLDQDALQFLLSGTRSSANSWPSTWSAANAPSGAGRLLKDCQSTAASTKSKTPYSPTNMSWLRGATHAPSAPAQTQTVKLRVCSWPNRPPTPTSRNMTRSPARCTLISDDFRENFSFAGKPIQSG